MIQTEEIKKQIEKNFAGISVFAINLLRGGLENENFIIKSSKKYVARIYSLRRTEEEIKNELIFITYLSSNEIPTPAPLLTQKKSTRFIFRNRIGALFPFITGKHIDKNKASLLQIAQLSKLVAQYHRISSQYPGAGAYRKAKPIRDFHFDWFKRFKKEHLELVPHYSFLDIIMDALSRKSSLIFFNKLKTFNHPLDAFQNLTKFTIKERNTLKKYKKILLQHFARNKFDYAQFVEKAQKVIESFGSFEMELQQSKLPLCITHYDYSDKNILFDSKGTVKAILDFDDSAYNYALFDLGNLALHWVIVNHQLSNERFEVLLANYTPFVSKELILKSLNYVLLERILEVNNKAQENNFDLLCVFSSYAQKFFNINKC